MSLIHLLLPSANSSPNYDLINMGINLDSLVFERATTNTGELKGALAAVYSSIALLSVAIWDTLLCLRIEYLTIWRARSSFLKWLYLATRYLGLITGGVLVGAYNSHALSASSHCQVLVKVTMALVTITCFARLLLRSYRIVAIYRFNHLLVGILTSASLSTTIVQGYLISGWVVQSLAPTSSGCFPVPDPEQRWVGPVYWAPLVLDSFLLFGLITSRTFFRYRASGEKSLVLFNLFWDDGARFQAMLFSVNLTAFILSILPDPFLGLFFLPFASVGSATLFLRPQSRPTSATPSGQGRRAQDGQAAEPNYLCGEFGSIQSQVNRRLLPISVGPEESTVQQSFETSAPRESSILPV
ncbi:hypothetical protein JCM3765_001354 [Sporobolomyces pararoseus]